MLGHDNNTHRSSSSGFCSSVPPHDPNRLLKSLRLVKLRKREAGWRKGCFISNVAHSISSVSFIYFMIELF
jgi:hypothetical protein